MVKSRASDMLTFDLYLPDGPPVAHDHHDLRVDLARLCHPSWIGFVDRDRCGRHFFPGRLGCRGNDYHDLDVHPLNREHIQSTLPI